jgi:formate dehydrogenase iron-sulfur subunit
MLYVLPEKPAVYGLPENPRTPDSINLWKDVVRPVGKLASVGAIGGVLGLTALTAMRRKGDK